MKFTANRKLLEEAAKTVLKIVRPSKEIPEIAGVLIEADEDSGLLTLTGTDVRTHIQRRLRQEHVEESGSVILTPMIADILSLLEGEIVAFQSDGGQVEIRAGNAVYLIPFLEAKAFPKLQIPFPEETVLVRGINTLLRRTLFAADGTTTDQNRVSMQYVKLHFTGESSVAEATNGNCIAVSASPGCADGDMDMILHEKALRTLSGIISQSDELYVGIAGKAAVFMKDGLFFSTLLFAGNYVECGRLLERFEPVYQAAVDAKSLKELVENASSIFQRGDSACFRLRIATYTIDVFAKGKLGNVNAGIDAFETTPMPGEGFYYNPELLTNCLRHLTGPLKLLLDKRGFMVLEANQSRYFVSPRGPAPIYTMSGQPEAADAKKKSKTAKNSKSKKAENKAA